MSGIIGSPGWKKFMAKLYGIGAAVVITGAMFKIMHWPGAGPMLVIGLSTEVIIFFFSAFEPLHEEIDWTLVYPELAGIHGEEGAAAEEKVEDKGSVTEQLDSMLEDAKIGPELIASLGEGMRSLSDQAGKLSNITDASVATNEYVTSVQSAAKNVNSLSDSYSNAAKSLGALAVSSDDSTSFGEQIIKVSKNLAALNASYELQLQGSNEHQKATANFYAGIGDLMKNLNDSVDDTKKYKEQIAQLSSNLESLNTVYGNMLTAMRKQKIFFNL
jgi:gliding motility-associated protein GldL